MDLAGSWTLSTTDGDVSAPMTLPGDGYTALTAPGVIPEPYQGHNEYAVRWVGECDWTARRTFTLSDPAVELVIEGLDTVAEVRVNGAIVLEAANAFRVWRTDLEGAARAGERAIEITFRTAPREAAARQEAQPFFLPWNRDNCPIPNDNMLRKPQCDFGCDRNIALAPFGLTEAIRVEPNRVERIDAVIVTEAHHAGAVDVAVEVRVPDGSSAGLAAEARRDGVGWLVTLSSRALAPFATVGADVPGRFADDAVTVLPDAPVTVRFRSRNPGAAPGFTTRDLRFATSPQHP